MSQQANFIELLRASLQDNYVPQLREPDFEVLLLMARQQAMSALIYPAVKKQTLSPALQKLYKEDAYNAVTREALQSKELSLFFDRCRQQGIPLLPLKGWVIKELYPQPALREMSDVDLLVPRQKRRTMATLMAQLGHTAEPVDADDTDVYTSPVGVRYEIHLSLKEDGFNTPSTAFCTQLEAYLAEGNLPSEVHYVYILCHFVKHLLYGGVGLRQLTDLYLWHKHKNADSARLRTLLQELELDRLHETVQALALHYFEGQAATETALELGDYLFSSGIYGNESQRQTDRMLRNGQGVSYYFHRCFPPLETMERYFPSLRRIPLLLPFFWLWRILRALCFRRSKMCKELELLDTQHQDDLTARVSFYRRCGLSVYEEKDV